MDKVHLAGDKPQRGACGRKAQFVIASPYELRRHSNKCARCDVIAASSIQLQGVRRDGAIPWHGLIAPWDR